jgi:hypothetical protein
MSSITAEYVIVNCQDRAKYRRKSDGKVTGFAITKTDEYPELDAETLKTEVLVPHISREGKKRIKEVFSEEQGADVKFDYIKREDAEPKYLKPGETFAVPSGEKLARITVSGLPADYKTLDSLADLDRILGLPDNKAEKPLYSPPTKD